MEFLTSNINKDIIYHFLQTVDYQSIHTLLTVSNFFRKFIIEDKYARKLWLDLRVSYYSSFVDKTKAFWEIVGLGDLETLKVMLKKYPELLTPSLWMAIKTNHYGISNYLILKGADVNGFFKGSPLIVKAVQTGILKKVEYLVAKGAKINTLETNNILSTAVINGYANIVAFLLGQGIKDTNVNNALNITNNPIIIRLLVEFANVNTIYDKAIDAIKQGNMSMFLAVISYDFPEEYLDLLLNDAIYHHRLDIASVLIDRGAGKSDNYKQAMIIASRDAYNDGVLFLLGRGASVNGENTIIPSNEVMVLREAPIVYAYNAGNISTVTLLIDYGSGGLLNIVNNTFLVRYFAKVNGTKQLTNAITYAIELGKSDAVYNLVKAGATVSLENLKTAIKNNRVNIFNFLLVNSAIDPRLLIPYTEEIGNAKILELLGQ